MGVKYASGARAGSRCCSVTATAVSYRSTTGWSDWYPSQDQLVGVTTMTDDFDPASAVQAAAAGDHQAWERLVDHYARPVRAVTGRFGLAEDDATDVYQTT